MVSKNKFLIFLSIALFAIGSISFYFNLSSKNTTTTKITLENINDDGSFVLTNNGPQKDFSNKKNLKVEWYSDPYCPDCIRTHSKSKEFIKKQIKNEKIEIKYHPLNFLPYKTTNNYSLINASLTSYVAEYYPDKLYMFLDEIYDMDYREKNKDVDTEVIAYELLNKLEIKVDKNKLNQIKMGINEVSSNIRNDEYLIKKSPKDKMFVPFIFEADNKNSKAFNGEDENTRKEVVEPLKKLMNSSSYLCSIDCS